jgi:hypothetical protein
LNGEEEILAPCGIDCIECPAYQGTRENDYERLAEILKEWAPKEEGYEPEDLVCDGCYGERVSRDCRVCWIKGCVEERGIPNCAHCGDYPCERLVKEWGSWRVNSAAEARARLDRMRDWLRTERSAPSRRMGASDAV